MMKKRLVLWFGSGSSLVNYCSNSVELLELLELFKPRTSSARKTLVFRNLINGIVLLTKPIVQGELLLYFLLKQGLQS